MIHARRIYQAGLAFPRELQCQVDWLVLWRRIGGGLSSAHHQELRNYLGDLGIGRQKPGTRLNSQLSMMVGVCWPALSICQARHARR